MLAIARANACSCTYIAIIGVHIVDLSPRVGIFDEANKVVHVSVRCKNTMHDNHWAVATGKLCSIEVVCVCVAKW